MTESLSAEEIAEPLLASELEWLKRALVQAPDDSRIRDSVPRLLAMASRLLELDWIPCSRQMPPTGLAVLVDGGVGYFDGIDWRTLMGADAHRKVEWVVSHWRRITTAPGPTTPKKGG